MASATLMGWVGTQGWKMHFPIEPTVERREGGREEGEKM